LRPPARQVIVAGVRQYPTDYRLWGLISAGMSFQFVGIRLMTEGLTRGDLARLPTDVLFLAVGCAVVGWAVHAGAVMCGLCLGGRPNSPQAADYDDEPFAAGPPEREMMAKGPINTALGRSTSIAHAVYFAVLENDLH
jgi:hypothetical protein